MERPECNQEKKQNKPRAEDESDDWLFVCLAMLLALLMCGR